MKKYIAFMFLSMIMISTYVDGADGRKLLKDGAKHTDKDAATQTGRKLLKDGAKHTDKDAATQTGRKLLKDATRHTNKQSDGV